jgi:Flp pilus assembly CpaE family ATPase
MTVLALASAKGSPGVTTAALALAVTWPLPTHVTIVEADPAGGDLAAWLDLPLQPGLVSLAAAGRRTIETGLLDQHLQAVPGSDQVAVLCGPVAAEQAHAALASLRDRLLDVVRLYPGVTIVDCGRLDPASPALRFFEQADQRIVVCRPSLAAIHHLQARLRSLAGDAPRLLAVGDAPYAADELARACGIGLLGSIALDLNAASTLGDGPALGERALARSPLIRSARTLATAMAADLHGTVLEPRVAPAPVPVPAGVLPPPPPGAFPPGQF